MLTLPRELLDAVVAHALRDQPSEACGVVAGRDGSATRVTPTVDAEHATQLHRFDGCEQLEVRRAMDDAGEVPLVVYHSQTASGARPSPGDIDLASLPDAHHLIADGTVTDVAPRVT